MSVYEHTNTNNTPSFSEEILVAATAHPSMSLMRLCVDKALEASKDILRFHAYVDNHRNPRSDRGKCVCV